jgi:hypothetical protein
MPSCRSPVFHPRLSTEHAGIRLSDWLHRKARDGADKCSRLRYGTLGYPMYLSGPEQARKELVNSSGSVAAVLAD